MCCQSADRTAPPNRPHNLTLVALGNCSFGEVTSMRYITVKCKGVGKELSENDISFLFRFPKQNKFFAKSFNRDRCFSPKHCNHRYGYELYRLRTSVI